MPIVPDVAGFPCSEVQFTKDGALDTLADLEGAAAFVKDGRFTDLFVMSHGWNNDMAEARTLYATFFARVRSILDRKLVPGLDGRKFGFLAILWPSKKFAERDLIPSGAAGAHSGRSTKDIEDHLDALKGFFDQSGSDVALEQAKVLLPDLQDKSDARRQFADLVRSSLPPVGPDPEGAAGRFRSKDGNALMEQFQRQIVILPPGGTGQGGAATGIGDFLQGVGDAVGGAVDKARKAIVDAGQAATDAAERLLNYATYYQMKERAGVVGMGGVHQVLARIRQGPGVKLHLIGHSFGGRLVTAATLGPGQGAPIKPQTMTLLQAAFSHNGFAKEDDQDQVPDGFFRKVADPAGKRLGGPVLITHTANDQAVGIAYALASRLAGQAGSALGDANDIFGGIGRNGAQHTPEAVFLTLGGVGTAYSFQAGAFHNLHAVVITNHGDICKDEVAYALLTAVATT